MIILIDPKISQSALHDLYRYLSDVGVLANPCSGGLRLEGGVERLDLPTLTALPGVLAVGEGMTLPLVQRKEDTEHSVVRVGEASFGKDYVCIAGPCAVESAEQILRIAHAVKSAGAHVLRGGCFKPRTSPHTFQGVGAEGIGWLVEAGKQAGLPTVCEVLSVEDLPLYGSVDMLQIGARNMQNFALLRAAAATGKPILLKRGMGATVEEWLASAEYILASGNPNVVLCERGVRHFATSARASLDLTTLPTVKARTHLPVIVDPSHACGDGRLVPSVALGVVAAGAMGLMIEVHDMPETALCDGPQAVTPAVLAELNGKIKRLGEIL